MARIRSIKPEFWTSEQITVCSLPARLLFIGLLTFCDDGGVHPASTKRLKMEVFPADPIGDDEMTRMIAEIVAAGLVREFKSAGDSFWHVTGWDRHQRIERPTIRHPRPPAVSTSDRQDLDESSPNARRDVVESSPPEWSGVDGSRIGSGVESEMILLSPDGDGANGLPVDSLQDVSEKPSTNAGTSPKFSDEDLTLAREMFDGIQAIQPNARPPNLDRWANDLRLLRSDGKDRTAEAIRATLAWVRQNQFWKSNILSPAKLREKWDQLQLKRSSQNESRTTTSKPDGLYREASQPGRRTF